MPCFLLTEAGERLTQETGFGLLLEICADDVVAPDPGGRIVAGFFSRGRWHELKRKLREEWECQEAALERAAELEGRPAQRLAKAAALAAQAIREAEISQLEFTTRLQKLCNALNAAANAQSMAQVIAESRGAIQHAQQIIAKAEADRIRAEQEEDEDEEIILHWLMKQ